MTRIRFGRLAVAGLTVALTFAAATHVRADAKAFNALEAAINKSHHIALNAGNYTQLAQSLHGTTPRTVRPINLATNQPSASNSSLTLMGNNLTMGKMYSWDRSQQACLLAICVNASDPYGVAINGLKKGDVVTVLNPVGVCGFSKDTGHPFLSSLIGLLGEGAEDAVEALEGTTQFNNVIQSATQDLQNACKATGAPEKLRDPFGIQPGTSGFGLEEGGLVVMMPQAGGIYYSGDSNNRSVWATQPRSITAARGCPAYLGPPRGTVVNVNTLPLFFVGHNAPNSGVCTTDGTAYILAWDFAYGDNTGTYQLVVRVTQGSASAPPSVSSSPAVARKARTTR
jgi:hypothetical protein